MPKRKRIVNITALLGGHHDVARLARQPVFPALSARGQGNHLRSGYTDRRPLVRAAHQLKREAEGVSAAELNSGP